jgi:DNA-binding NarL/FixJ family response regulator
MISFQVTPKQDFTPRPSIQAQRPPSTIEVFLADDHHLVRSGIRALLGTIPGVRVTAEASEGSELLSLLESVHPDIVITDISMPGMDGLSALAEIRARHPGVKVIVLSMHDSADVVKRAVAGGAAAYLRKDANEFELGSALHSVMTTGSYLSAGIARLLLEPTRPTAEELLTPRQTEILKLLAQGKSSKEIAFALGLSSKTVDVHRARIMDRLGVRDVANLTLYAVRNGLLNPAAPLKPGRTSPPCTSKQPPGWWRRAA